MIKKLLAWLFCLLSAITGIAPAGTVVANAAEQPKIEYTSVLEDLQKDATFQVEDYPYIADDHSLQVLQIAESVNEELFVYVYQPSGPSRILEATTIRLATPTKGADATWHDYDLTLISAASVFHKYRVEDFTVSNAATRYYDITAIHRLWYDGIDAPLDTETDQTVNEVVFPVGKVYKAQDGYAGSVSYYHDSDIVTVTAKVVGFIYYEDPSFWSKAACDRHIVAFSVDRAIDKLYEVDLEYKSVRIADGVYNGSIIYGGTPIGDIVANEKTVHADKEIVYDEDGVFVDTHYSFAEIMTTGNFIAESNNVNFVKGALNDLKDTDFVLTFDVTSVENYGTILTQNIHFGKYRTSIGNVTIIRLKYEVNGEMFNLGVVDNKQTGSQLGSLKKFPWLLLLLIIAIVVVFLILMIAFPGFIKFVFWILKAVGVVIAWPVLLTILIVQKAKGG